MTWSRWRIRMTWRGKWMLYLGHLAGDSITWQTPSSDSRHEPPNVKRRRHLQEIGRRAAQSTPAIHKIHRELVAAPSAAATPSRRRTTRTWRMCRRLRAYGTRHPRTLGGQAVSFSGHGGKQHGRSCPQGHTRPGQFTTNQRTSARRTRTRYSASPATSSKRTGSQEAPPSRQQPHHLHSQGRRSRQCRP